MSLRGQFCPKQSPFEQIGLAVAVGILLVDDGFAFEVRDAVVDADTLGAGDEKGRTGFARFVLDVGMLTAMVTETLQKRARLFASFDGAFQLHFAAGKVVVLDVDNK